MIVAEAECILSQLCPILTEPTSASSCVALSALHNVTLQSRAAFLLYWSLLSDSVQRSMRCTRLADSRVLLGLRATPLWSLNECLVSLVAQWHKSFAQEVLSRSAIDACPGPILAICLLLPLLNSAGAIDCELSVENGCAVERVAGLPMVCQWYFIGY